MRDRNTGEWRPRKSWGGAGKGAHKVAAAPPAAKATRPRTAGKKPRKRAAAPRARVEQLHIADEPETDGETWQDIMMDRDPAAAWQEAPGPEPEPETPAAKEAKELRQEVEAWIALGWSIPAEALEAVDPYCFGPLVDPETGPLVIKAFADIAMQSPKVVEFIASKTGLRPYIQLAYVFKPVLQNAWRHHITRKVEVDVDRATGTYTVQPRDMSQYPAA